MTAAIWIGCGVAAYLLGSIPTGYLWAKAKGIDIRTVGSGNIGATNVMRALGKGPGIMVLVIDALKGFLPVFFAPRIFEGGSHLQILCCVGVIAGHNWTCWLNFKGGKGIATSAGALLAMLPGPFGCVLAVWAGVFAVSRYVSLASIVAAAVLPVATWFWQRDLVWFTGLIAVVAIWKHKSNIQRLRAGTENRVGGKKTQ
ncbi:MAG: Glycerol-3-phosphate acyltransferase [Verrucomicrobiae bacterium]|nr:Glycerol-3-phosphate acyltransferase [Verrucomicrobiae bacterium]